MGGLQSTLREHLNLVSSLKEGENLVGTGGMRFQARGGLCSS